MSGNTVWLCCNIHSASVFVKLIAECEQVKTERESDLIIDQVLIAMSAMGLDRERTLQVRTDDDVWLYCLLFFDTSHVNSRLYTVYNLELKIE